MARSTSALHRVNDENSMISDNESNQSSKLHTPKHGRRLSSTSTNTLKTFLSDYDNNFDSDSSLSSNASPMTSASAMRRSRKNWTEAEEACLISGVEKHGENWELILSDPQYGFNSRIPKDLRLKYRALISNSSTSAVDSEAIFDIRTANDKVTEVFIGADWSRAQWTSSEDVKPVERLESLVADFEKKIAAKQKMISRISPARTPSRFISSLSLNNANSSVKRRTTTGASGSESSHDESDFVGTPLKKMKASTLQHTNNSPLSVKSTKSTRSTASNKSTKSNTSNKSRKSQREVLLLHSDAEEDAANLVYPDEETEPVKGPKSNRCIIM